MGNLEWRRNAQPPSPLQPDEYQNHKKSDSKWNDFQRPPVDKQPAAPTFHSEHENEDRQGSLVQGVDDLSLQIRRHASFTPNRACTRWVINDNCTSTSCPWAHHLFPRVVYRAHRNGIKEEHCQYASSSAGGCRYAEDMCGFSHEAITPEVEQKQKQMLDRIAEQKKDWVAELALKCQKCSFSVDGDKWDAVEEMIDHCKDCKKQHPPLSETASRNALSPTTASSFMTIQPADRSLSTARYPSIFTGVEKEGDNTLKPPAALDDNLEVLLGSGDRK